MIFRYEFSWLLTRRRLVHTTCEWGRQDYRKRCSHRRLGIGSTVLLAQPVVHSHTPVSAYFSLNTTNAKPIKSQSSISHKILQKRFDITYLNSVFLEISTFVIFRLGLSEKVSHIYNWLQLLKSYKLTKNQKYRGTLFGDSPTWRQWEW